MTERERKRKAMKWSEDVKQRRTANKKLVESKYVSVSPGVREKTTRLPTPLPCHL